MKKEYRNESGRYHRTDGPAIIHNSGTKSWWINGQYHREDGPAIEWFDGGKEWWINGIEYTEQEYNQEIIKLKLKRLIEL